ncbi:MAG: NAD-dependent DNA ligase LigA [Chlamydia sp.]
MRSITAKDEYEMLCDDIWRYNRLYFQEASPEISDEEYDALLLALEQIEVEHPEWVSPTSPTKRVGEAPLADFPEVAHKVPMLSLEKAFQVDELEAFYNRLAKLVDRKSPALFGQPKMDGLAISVIYENGHFVRAVTRGNGAIGSDISLNCKTIPRLPLRIKNIFSFLEVRGEVFMLKKRFQEINRERELQGLPLFANPRNAAAGSLKLLDSRELSKRSGLEIVFYGISEQSPTKVLFQHQIEETLSSLGLPTFSNLPYITFPMTKKVVSIEEIMAFQKELHRNRGLLPFHIDGVVFKLDSIDEALSIPSTNKHPRTAIAWKFGAEQTWTILESITVQVGRTGVITPVAELLAVELDGSIVKRATLHNSDEIERKDIRIGDRVLIEKSGDIIPKVVMVDSSISTRNSSWQFPVKCPSCSTLLVRDQDGVSIRCPNRETCPEQRIKEIIHFAGKSGLDIEHVGEKLIRNLYDRGLIKTSSDLFTLTQEKLMTIDGIREKSADNIIKSLEKAKNPRLDVLLMALGIRHIGKNAASDLAQKMGVLHKLFSITLEELIEIEGFGSKMAESIIAAQGDRQFCAEIERLLEVGVHPLDYVSQPAVECFSHPLYGKKVVITGSLQKMTRTEAMQELEKRGAVHSDSVSKKVSYVIIGEAPGSKREKAALLGIPMLNEEDFILLLNNLL